MYVVIPKDFNPDTLPVPIYHASCGTVVFYYKEAPKVGEDICSASAIMPNGSTPAAGQPVPCVTCGLVCVDDLTCIKPGEFSRHRIALPEHKE